MQTRIEKPEQLMNWLEENDLLLQLTREEAEVTLGYLEGHGYGLVGDGMVLHRVNIEDPEDEMEYPIDCIVDVIAEWNYELLQDTEEALKHCRAEEEKEIHDYLMSLKRDESVIDKMLQKTIYKKAV